MKNIYQLPNGTSLLSINPFGHYCKDEVVLQHIEGAQKLHQIPLCFGAIPAGMALLVSVNFGMSLLWIENDDDFAEATHPSDVREKVWLYIP